MLKRVREIAKAIPEVFHLSNKEFFLTIAARTLLGVVMGMLISPRKNQRFGCDNGNNFFGSDYCLDDLEDELEENL